MKRNNNIELFRCICMFGVVCIHAFSWTGKTSHVAWALCCPSLVGFVMISAWFGIHFKWIKILRLLGIVFFCAMVAMIFTGRGWNEFIACCKSYWYVWAYVFMMMFAPIVDAFIEKCADRRDLVRSFASIAVLLWGWSHIAVLEPLSRYVPQVSGFGDSSGVVLLCVYILTRLIRRLEWVDWLMRKKIVLCVAFIVSGAAVALGFRHMHSFFAYVFAMCAFLLVNSIPLSERNGKFFSFLGPSMFSVYLFHIPFRPGLGMLWESIHNSTNLPNVICQLLVAIIVFVSMILLDLPRRIIVLYFQKFVGQFK